MNPLTKIAAASIRLYQVTLSPMTRLLLGPYAACRFHPTCSEYARQAVLKHGLFSGGWMGFKRLFRCHPFHPGGYDPVPDCACHCFAEDKEEAQKEVA
ncbi:MAG: membrane protein insertion efficiency factor YidD [Puniceicoccales bacterium]